MVGGYKMFWNKYPYTNFHELNLDWILRQIKELTHEMDEFKVINSIRFFGPWQITSQYPTWAIVDDGNGNGYLSIQPVPVGVTLDNADYWVLVANYSALFADVMTRIIALEGDMQELQSVQPPVRNIIFIGDSYSQGATSWVEYTKQCLHGNLGVNYYNGEGGAGFLAADYRQPGDPYHSFLELLQQIAGNVTDPDEITDIVVCGGYNDMSAGHLYISLLQQRMIEFVSYCKSTYKNALVSIGMIGHSVTAVTQDLLMTETYFYYRLNAIEAGAKYLSGVETSITNNVTEMNADGIHPTALGNLQIARNVTNLLQGGNVVTAGTIGSTITVTDGTSTMALYQRIEGDTIVLSADYSVTEFTNPLTYAAIPGAYIDLGEIDTPLINPHRPVDLSVPAVIQLSPSGFTNAYGVLSFSGDHILYRLTYVENNSWASVNIKHIEIMPFSINVDRHTV